MTSANDWISEDLKPATLLSVHEENGVVTKVYVAPCFEQKTKVEPLVERKPEVFPEANTLLFQCPFCGNGIRTGGAYKVHLMACERRFAWMMKNEGPVVPQLKCSICKETFSSAEALINHRLQHRSPSMKRTCGSCHVKFETELEYRTHLESHLIPRKSKDESYEGAYTITKLFDCLFCRKEFLACFRPGQVSRRYACDECVRRLKAQEAEKKLCVKRKAELCCDRCGRKYKYEGFLNRHLKTCQVPEKFKRKREN